MGARQLEQRILEIEKKLEQEEKYNYIIDLIFFIIYPILAIILFTYFWNQNKGTIETYSEVLELVIFVIIILFSTYLLSNSRPVKEFIMEWCLLKRLVELKLSKPTRKEIIKFIFAIIFNGSITALTAVTEIIPGPYTLVLNVYIGVLVLSFPTIILMSFIVSRIFKINLALYAQIKGKWKPIVKSIIGITALLIWSIGAIIVWI